MMTELMTMAEQAASAADAGADALKMASATHLNGSFTLGVAGAGAGIGVGLTGLGATLAVGRNPGAFGNILTIAIIGMALAEAIAIYALVLALGGR